MIQSYKEELRSRKRKNMFFWSVVFTMTFFLYLFFQWYYINIDFKIDSGNRVPSPYLKQFWIINLHVFPNPDNIFINWQNYWNWSKPVFDYWTFEIEVYKDWYIPVRIATELNSTYPIYYETVNLFSDFKYNKLYWTFDDIYKVDSYYFATIKNLKTIYIYTSDFKPLRMLDTDMRYIGYKYFSKNDLIYTYDADKDIFSPLLSKDTWLQSICKNLRTYHDRLFCYDNMDFIDWSKMQWGVKVLRINDNIILTENHIYNNWNWWDWWTYKHGNWFIYDPTNLVHLDNIPYILEDWYLYNLENTKRTKFEIPDLDVVKKAFEFWKETLLVWYKQDKVVFVLSDEKKRFTGYLPKTDLNNFEVIKIDGAYMFNTWENIFLYYKWSEKLRSILSWEDINFVWNMAFFKKNWANFRMNLSQPE